MSQDSDSTRSQAIIDKMLGMFRALDSYHDCGYVVDTVYADTPDENTTRIDFKTTFKRSDQHLFRFQWQHPSTDEPSGVWAAAIWSNGKAVFSHYPATGTTVEKSIGWSIGAGGGALSSGAAYKSLFLLMAETESDCAHHFPLDRFEWVSMEDMFGEKCHHLQKVVVGRAFSVRNTELWISAGRFTLLKMRETAVIDHIRFDAWDQGLLGDDPLENERIIEERRNFFRKHSERKIQDYIREHTDIQDWRRRAFELGPEPRPRITETFYTQVSLNCPIADESNIFGDNF